jgi:ParB-like chromosome segregation protein Spo0J
MSSFLMAEQTRNAVSMKAAYASAAYRQGPSVADSREALKDREKGVAVQARVDHRAEPEDIVALNLADLVPSQTVRLNVDKTHVDLLLEAEAEWPPILVSARDRRIIDGVHRYHAALKAGKSRITCSYFYGSPEDELRESIRRNTAHGLPLTLEERRRAAQRILALKDGWSDRMVGELCGLSASTIARLRSSMIQPLGEPEKREGRDGRLRPTNPDRLRRSAEIALLARPDASLREIARDVGASPTTVASVRKKLTAKEQSSIPETLATQPSGGPEGEACSYSDTYIKAPAQKWLTDSALQSTPAGNEFVSWLCKTAVDIDDLRYGEVLPLSRIYEVADEARLRAVFWEQFASVVEDRAGRSSSTDNR